MLKVCANLSSRKGMDDVVFCQGRCSPNAIEKPCYSGTWAELRLVPCPLTLSVPGEVDIVALNIRLTADIVDKTRHAWCDGSTQGPLDLDRTGHQLQVRFRQPGDRFHPLGAPGVKKLQDFFIDSRVPRVERPYVPLMMSDREIVWVVGYRIAEPLSFVRRQNALCVCSATLCMGRKLR